MSEHHEQTVAGLHDPAAVVDNVAVSESPQMDRLQIQEQHDGRPRTPVAVREERFTKLRSGSSVDVCG
jgi:hypothetical protein